MKLMGPIEQQALMQTLLKYVTQRRLAKALGVAQSTLNYWLNAAKKIPYEKVLLMQALLEKREQRQQQITVSSKIQNLNQKNTDRISTQFPVNKNPIIEKEKISSEPKSLIDINLVYQNSKLIEAEARYHLPLRTSLAVLVLYCCDKHGEFPLNVSELKKEVLPYIDIDFVSIIKVLCDLGWVEEFCYEGKPYGFIALEAFMGSMPSSKAQEQENYRPDGTALSAVPS